MSTRVSCKESIEDVKRFTSYGNSTTFSMFSKLFSIWSTNQKVQGFFRTGMGNDGNPYLELYSDSFGRDSINTCVIELHTDVLTNLFDNVIIKLVSDIPRGVETVQVKFEGNNLGLLSRIVSKHPRKNLPVIYVNRTTAIVSLNMEDFTFKDVFNFLNSIYKSSLTGSSTFEDMFNVR